MFRLNIISTLRSVFAPLSHTHDDKVDKVTGKGLSTNDYTTDEKNKLAGIAAGANKTVVDSALSSSSANPVQNSVINTALGNKVDKVSGKGLSTNDFTGTYKTALDNLNTTIATAVGNLEMIEVVTSLPTSNIKNNKLYLKANSVSGSENKYDIYVRVNNAWEKVDSLDFSISDYIKKDSNTNLLLSNGTTKAQSSFIANSTGSVTSNHIADKTIVNGDIADATIEQAKMKLISANGGSSTAGYVKVMKIVFTGGFPDRPITFDMSQRHITDSQHFSIKFQTGNHTNYDAPLELFTYSGSNEWKANHAGSAYIYKEGTATYSVIIQKSEAYDGIYIRNLISDVTATITYPNELLTDLPTSNITPATYIGFTSAEKTKLAGIATGANAYSHPSYTARTGKPTANQTPSFGGTATVSQIKSDSTGHVTEANDFTIKIPNTVANGTTAGLSTNDYTTAEKNKLAAITESADAVSYSQTVASSTSGAYEVGKITINGTATTIYGKDTNTTYSAVGTTGNPGLMTAADKVKLNNVATGATKTSFSYTNGVLTINNE